MIDITEGPIDFCALTERARRGDCGAVVLFLGTVRELTAGRRTRFLEYQAYRGMAEKKMAAIEHEVRERWPVGEVAMVHRLGRLEIGETSVLIVVASAHRAAAFDACRWLIDTLKRTVPIWKKEYFEDGMVWADGEPFPAEIPRPQGTSAIKRASK